ARRLAHRVEPLAVLLQAAVERIVELALDHAGDLAWLAHVVVIDLADRYQLSRCTGEEDLLGEVKLCAGDVPLDPGVAEVLRDLNHGLAGDPVENRRVVARRDDLAVADQVDVLARALADKATLVEQDRLVVTGVGALGLGENRVEVLARGL